jgi:hypothetical protein
MKTKNPLDVYMSYLADPFALFDLIAEFITFFLLTAFNVQIYRKSKRKGSKVSPFLFWAFIAFSGAAIFESLDIFFLEDVTRDALGYEMSVGYCAAMFVVAIANYFLLAFSYEIYSEQQNHNPKIIGTINIILISIFVAFKMSNNQEIATILLIGHILISVGIYAFLSKESLKNAARMKGAPEKLPYKLGFELIGFFGICLIAAFALFIMEEFATLVTQQKFTIFSAFAWIVVNIGAFSAFVGFTLPQWFVKLTTRGKGSTPSSSQESFTQGIRK